MIPLSVLDLSFVTSGGTGAQALANTLDLARFADRLGFRRFWVAEHHNLPSVASAAPEIMIGQIAAVTQHLRVGSGGVMLPNHAPLMVAERFKLLEALFPGRIDLGLGRAPGTDPATTYALRRRQDERFANDPEQDFLDRLQELILWQTGGFPEGHPFRAIKAMPSDAPLPPLWLLGSSDYSARLAGSIGTGFAFAHHFATHDAEDALLSYRAGFKPTFLGERPRAILTVAAIVAPTAEEAERVASSADLCAAPAQGEYAPLPSPQEAEAAAASFTPTDRAIIRQNRQRLFVGTPESVREEISALAARTQADEVMITAAIHDHGARLRSYELLADAFGLAAERPAAVAADAVQPATN